MRLVSSRSLSLGDSGMAKFTSGTGGAAAMVKAHEHAMAFGVLAASWAELEHSFVLALQFVAGVPYYKAEIILFSLANHKARRDILVALGKTIKLDDVRKDYLDLINSVKSLASKRNTYTHASWIRDEKSGEMFLLNHQKQGHQDRTRHVRATEIAELAAECTAKASAITQFFAGLHRDGRSIVAFAP